MTKKITWRLGALPTPKELRGLVTDKLITKEEAREILFREETIPVEKDERDAKSYQSEITFLREIIQKLSSSNKQTVEVFTLLHGGYRNYPWYQPYGYWANSAGITSGASSGAAVGSSFATAGNGTTGNIVGGSTKDFTSIKTF